jgi:hypothetical protein
MGITHHNTGAHARNEIRALVAKLEAELHIAAEAGDIHTCDVRHGQIADCESVMAMLEGER